MHVETPYYLPTTIAYSMVVMYIRENGSLGQNITQKQALLCLHDSLAVLVRHDQTQKCFKIDPTPPHQVSVKLLFLI